jgi:membrane-associated protease RseP (regulator of RpoE activity)
MTLPHKVMKSMTDTSKYYSWYGVREEWNVGIDTNKTLIVPNLSISKAFDAKNLIIGGTNRRIGLIGLDFMRDYVTTFDWKNKKITLSDYLSTKIFDTFGYYAVFQDDKIVVHSLIQNSIAEQQGLRNNDHIVKINDHDVSTISLQDFCQIKDPYLQDTVKLSVKRNNEILNFVLPKVNFKSLIK